MICPGRRYRRKNLAFSLIEVMIAMVIFTVGIIAVMYLFPLGARTIGKAKEVTAASFLGQAKMEEVLLLPADQMPSLSEGDFGPEYPLLYFRVQTVSPYSGKDSLVYVSVDVEKYLVSGSRSSIYHLETLKCLGGAVETNW
ncbi:MAG: prepilin-type N-terminal cleavage/methylation domain-containing protein [Candidatus Eremiobacteraeota bacterium]|nr:prepilin-type N-terminal cleavage/methylation domain-containing protein [Candidatus Eremiobacteraeota bacterium]